MTEESNPSKVARLEINEEPPPPPALYLPDLSFPVPLPPPPPMYVESPSLGTVPFSYIRTLSIEFQLNLTILVQFVYFCLKFVLFYAHLS